MDDNANRRPLKSRDTSWARAVAAWLCRLGIKPNTISIGSVLVAAGGGATLAATGLVSSDIWAAILFIVAPLCMQMRLLCNLFDGMVAIEGGLKSNSGELFNDVPDRFADSFLLIGAGYAIVPWFSVGPVLGYCAALLAVGTAYVRVLGAATGAGHQFLGPMAKQQRMALLTFACLVAAAEVFFWPRGWAILIALSIIVAGSLLTIIRRLCRIYTILESQE